MATGLQHYRPAGVQEATSERESLVLEHLPQVCLIARRIHDRLPDYISLDDLISTGVIGLILAVAYIASGSLWWVMAVHALLDLYGGLLAWRISQMPEAAQPTQIAGAT